MAAADFPDRTLAQHDHVLAASRQVLLREIAGIPDARFAHEIKAHQVEHRGFLALCIRTEKDGGAEDSLKSTDQAPVLGTPLVQAKRCPAWRPHLKR